MLKPDLQFCIEDGDLVTRLEGRIINRTPFDQIVGAKNYVFNSRIALTLADGSGRCIFASPSVYCDLLEPFQRLCAVLDPDNAPTEEELDNQFKEKLRGLLPLMDDILGDLSDEHERLTGVPLKQ